MLFRSIRFAEGNAPAGVLRGPVRRADGLTQFPSDALRQGAIAIPDGKLELYAQTLWSAFHGLISLHIGLSGEPWVEWASMDERVDLMFNLLMVGVIKETSGN